METIVHACDISNPIKKFDIYFQWAERVLEEFWNQVMWLLKGDIEKSMGLEVTQMCDRDTTNLAKS